MEGEAADAVAVGDVPWGDFVGNAGLLFDELVGLFASALHLAGAGETSEVFDDF